MEADTQTQDIVLPVDDSISAPGAPVDDSISAPGAPVDDSISAPGAPHDEHELEAQDMLSEITNYSMVSEVEPAAQIFSNEAKSSSQDDESLKDKIRATLEEHLSNLSADEKSEISFKTGKRILKKPFGKAVLKLHKEFIKTVLVEIGTRSPPPGDVPPPKSNKKRGKSEIVKRASKKPQVGPKKAQTAFFAFSAEMRPKLKADDPGLSITEISTNLGAQWKALSEEAKAPYKEKYKEDKLRYQREMEDIRIQNPDLYQIILKSTKRKGKSDEDEKKREPAAKKRKIETDEEDNEQHAVDTGNAKSNAKSKKLPEREHAEIKEEAERFLSKMDSAFKDDKICMKLGKPPIHKINLLNEVSIQVSKRYLQTELLDQHLLRYFNHWLRPFKDGTLPNLELRTTLFKLLDGMSGIDLDRLQNSAAKDWTVDDKDGKYQVVEDDDSKEMALSYTLNKIKKNKSELDENKATLNKIIIKWKQIVSDVSTDFRDLKKYEELRKDEILDRRRNVIERASFPRTRGRMAPLRGNCDFVIRPVNKISFDDENGKDEAIEQRTGDDLKSSKKIGKHDELIKLLKDSGKKHSGGQRNQGVEVNGKHLISGSKPKCQICDLACESLTHLESHIQTRHGGVRNLTDRRGPV